MGRLRVSRSPEVVERILEAVSGGTPLAEVCREDWAPHPSNFYKWLREDPELDQLFAEARDLGHDVIAANTRSIARGKEGSSGDVKRDRLAVETDLKLLEKWDRRYRPAQVIAGDPDAPLIPAPPHIDHAETLAAILGVLLKRKARAEREGLNGPLSTEQFDYLALKHPMPAPVPINTYRSGWRPGAVLNPHDGSDLA